MDSPPPKPCIHCGYKAASRQPFRGYVLCKSCIEWVERDFRIRPDLPMMTPPSPKVR